MSLTTLYLTLFPSFKLTPPSTHTAPSRHKPLHPVSLYLPRPALWLIDSVRADRATRAADRQWCKSKSPDNLHAYDPLLSSFSVSLSAPPKLNLDKTVRLFLPGNKSTTISPSMLRTLWCLRLKGEGTPAYACSTTSAGYVCFSFRRPRRFVICVSSCHFANRLLRPPSGWSVSMYHSTSVAHPEGSNVASQPTQVLMQHRANALCTGYHLDA